MNLSPSHQHSPGSLPPWPLRDFNTPLPFLLQEDLQLPPSLMSPKSASPSPSLNPPPLLSSPASMGASTAKVSKRKSRAVTKPPIRVLSTDRASFRDMVQKLTGIPTSPSVQASHLWGANNSSGIAGPLVARPGLHSDLMAPAHHQSMPTLDTSSPYLSRGFSSDNLVYSEMGKSRFHSILEANFDPSMRPALNFNPSGGAVNFDWSGRVMYEGRAVYNEGGVVMDMESLQQLQRASEMERSPMGSNKLGDVLQSNKMDHWFSPDLMGSLSPKVEAHST